MSGLPAHLPAIFFIPADRAGEIIRPPWNMYCGRRASAAWRYQNFFRFCIFIQTLKRLIMKYYLLALRRYAQFAGRSNRSEYWYFILFHFLFLIAALILDSTLGMAFADTPYGIIYMVYALALAVPSLSVGVRRLHDIGKSGWYVLLGLIPLIGGIWLIVLMVKRGDPGENKYGPDPNGELLFEFEENAQQQ